MNPAPSKARSLCSLTRLTPAAPPFFIPERKMKVFSFPGKKTTHFFSNFFKKFLCFESHGPRSAINIQRRWRSPSTTVRDRTIPTATITAALQILTVPSPFLFPSHGARVWGSQEAHRAAPKASPESPTDHGFHAAVSAFWAAMQLLSPTDL